MKQLYIFSTNRISRKIKFFFLLASMLFFEADAVFAQQKFTINGVIKDAATGETLIGASLKLQEIEGSGTASNSYGFYSLSAPAGNYHLLVSYTGYQTVSKVVELKKNLRLNLELKSGSSLNEVVINGRPDKNQQISSAQMGLQAISITEIKDVPVLFGEKDVLKTIQLLPGIMSAGEGSSGFYVRGGTSDQNLILLDEATVYNASHLLGFFSTFNSDAIKEVNVYKGNEPAQYGGRLASVVDIRMNDGNQKEYTAEGGIGLIASRLKIEGPIVKDRGSFMISGRRTYADVFLKLSSDTTLKQSSLYFYDLNLKANYRLDAKNTIYLSGYTGKDALGLGNTFNLNWGNQTGTLRLNHLFSDKLFSNTTLIYSNYDYAIQNSTNNQDFKVTSKIRDFELKEDFEDFVNDKHVVRFGLDAVHHDISPGKITSSATSSVNSTTIEDRYGADISAYISDEWRASNRLNVIYGLRLNTFTLLGPGTFNTYNADATIKTSATYGSGKIVKTYINPEPRLSASYRLDSISSIKASYSRNVQNLHLLSNSTSTLPTDLWIMSSNNVKNEIADQEALGYYRNLKDGAYEFSSEIYYKGMQNQIDYKNAAQLRANGNVESQLVFGTGRAYGIELFLKKKTGVLTGWLSYTLSRTERRFDSINNGGYFPAKQDRTHDISAVGIYKLSKRWTLSGTFVYSTGNAVTFPSGKYNIEGQTAFYYTERNGYRMPAYHRLDLGATLEGKPHPKFHSSWTFSLYNAYDHKNAYVIGFIDDPNNPGRTVAQQTALFGIIPSVTWNFKF